MKICKNCANSYEGKFCSNCGQKYIDARLTIKDSIAWLFSSIFNLERGFLFTIKEMFLRPGQVIHHFISGITIRYAHPFRFLFVLATISTIVALYSHAYDEINEISSQFVEQSERQRAFGKKWAEILKQYMSIVILISIPFYSLSSKLIYWRKKYHYAEHLVLNSYANGLFITLSLPVTFSYLFFENKIYLSYISMGLTLVVIGYVYSKFFKENILFSMLKFLVIYILSFTFAIFLGIFGVLIHILLIKFAGFPNIYKMVETAGQATI